MCFTNSDRTNDPPPKPAQIPQQSYLGSTSQPKAHMPQRQQQDYAPPPGPPPPSHDYAAPAGPPPSHGASSYSTNTDFAPPSGPPPSQSYPAPSGPPPSKNNPFYDYAPPSGPPPTKNSDGFVDYAPPPGPPPSAAPGEKKHDWETAVPDTSLLPPPPNFFGGFDRSPANNSTEAEAEEGERWVAAYALYPPIRLDPTGLAALQQGNINVFKSPTYTGSFEQTGLGVWKGSTPRDMRDSNLTSFPPLYSVAAHSPIATGRKKTIYYEVRILSSDVNGEVPLALGFTAPPYPFFRLPGWHRASLGVHGDDGHRYVNDRWGGKSFTRPFRKGETVGLGMDLHPAAGGGGIAVDVFLTRDGTESERWNIHEETDLDQDLPVTGLEGFHDLVAAVGVFNRIDFEIVFNPSQWLWRGYQG